MIRRLILSSVLLVFLEPYVMMLVALSVSYVYVVVYREVGP